MNTKQFDSLIASSQLGRKAANPASLEAARLHFVGESVKNVSECARRAGCTKQAAAVAIARVKELMADSGLVPVFVLVPKGKRRAIEKAAAELVKKKA